MLRRNQDDWIQLYDEHRSRRLERINYHCSNVAGRFSSSNANSKGKIIMGIDQGKASSDS